MKQKVLILIAIAVVLTFAVSSFALAEEVEENTIETQETGGDRSSNYLNAYSAEITGQGSNTMRVSFGVYATRVMNKVGVVQIIIEKNAGNGWAYDRTLYHNSYPNFIRLNAIQNVSSVTFSGVKNYRYRVTITAYAADSTGFDYKLAYSGSAICY